jgi:hypothetical protein
VGGKRGGGGFDFGLSGGSARARDHSDLGDERGVFNKDGVGVVWKRCEKVTVVPSSARDCAYLSCCSMAAKSMGARAR